MPEKRSSEIEFRWWGVYARITGKFAIIVAAALAIIYLVVFNWEKLVG